MGSASPKGFSRGKRGVAGSLIFLVFDRSALIDALSGLPWNWYVTPRADVRKGQDPHNVPIENPNTVGGGSVGRPTAGITEITLDRVWARPRFVDQIPPFNVTITAENEYGHYAMMRILGLEILNQGSGMSIDDITTDEACTFVAQDLETWKNATTHAMPSA